MSIDLNALDNMDFSETETGFPIIAAGLYEFEISEIKAEENKARTGHNIVIKLALTQPAKTPKGADIQPGFAITHRMSLVPTDKFPESRIKSNCAEVMECFLGTKVGRFLPLEQFLGQKGFVQLGVSDTPEYGTQNNVKRFVKKG